MKEERIEGKNKEMLSLSISKLVFCCYYLYLLNTNQVYYTSNCNLNLAYLCLIIYFFLSIVC